MDWKDIALILTTVGNFATFYLTQKFTRPKQEIDLAEATNKLTQSSILLHTEFIELKAKLINAEATVKSLRGQLDEERKDNARMMKEIGAYEHWKDEVKPLVESLRK